MATTTIQPLPYPLPGESPDVPRDIKALAEAVEGRVVMRFASLATRNAALPSGTLVDGMVCYVASENAVYLRSGGQWRIMWSDTGWQNVTLASGFTATYAVQVRRIGAVVYWRGRVQRDAGGFVPGTQVNIIAAGGVPTWARPTSSFAETPAVTSNGVTWAYIQADTVGAVAIRPQADGSAPNNFLLAPLSGYLAD